MLSIRVRVSRGENSINLFDDISITSKRYRKGSDSLSPCRKKVYQIIEPPMSHVNLCRLGLETMITPPALERCSMLSLPAEV